MWLELCLAGDLLLGMYKETRCKPKELKAVKRKRELVSKAAASSF